MKIGQINSIPLETTCGVPRGSILGPILFIMAIINDLLLISFASAFSYYADDTVTCSTGNSCEESIANCTLLLQDVKS